MTKHKNIRLGRMLKKCITFLLLFLFAVTVFFFIKGYLMHKKATIDYPVTKMMSDIIQQENYVKYEDLPKIYIDAVISAEDKRFFKHNGFDYISTGSAFVNDVISISFAEGGSTITQQLAKNQFYTQEKKLERKVAEIFSASEIEKSCDKRTIFELYVNTIYFGSGYYGIYDAAQGYYGKMPNELTDYEAVMLAGLPNAPSVYSPNVNADLAEKRMKTVLKQMVDCDALSHQDADTIIKNGR